MNLNNKTTKITETVVIISIMVVFAFLGFYTLPVLNILYPVPAIIIGARNGLKYSILSILASSLVIGTLIDIYVGLFLLIIFGFFGVTLSYMIKKRYSPYKVFTVGTFVYFISTIILILVLQVVTGINFGDYLYNSLNSIMDMQLEITKNMGFSGYEFFQIKDIFEDIIDYIVAIVPSLLVVFSVFISYINYWISSVILGRVGYPILYLPKFSKFKLPQNIIIGSGIIFISTMLLKYFIPDYYETVLLNMIIITLFVFFLQGVAVLYHLMDKLNSTKFVKGLIVFFIILYGPLGLIISFVGFLDSLFNFRKI